jgi:hypothetical protein
VQTYDVQLPQQRQQLFFLLSRDCRVVALIHRRKRVAFTFADVVDLLHVLCEEVRESKALEPAFLVDFVDTSQRLLDGNHVWSMDVVNINLLNIKEVLARVRKALHALRSHGARDKTAGCFGVDLEAFAAAGLAEDLFARAVDVCRVDFADAGFFQNIVNLE